MRTSGVAAAPYVANTGSYYVQDPRVSGPHSPGPYRIPAITTARQTVEHNSSYRESDKPLREEKQVHHGYHSKHLGSEHDEDKKSACSAACLAVVGIIALVLILLALLFGLGVIGPNNPDPNNTSVNTQTQVASANRPTTTTTTSSSTTTTNSKTAFY